MVHYEYVDKLNKSLKINLHGHDAPKDSLTLSEKAEFVFTADAGASLPHTIITHKSDPTMSTNPIFWLQYRISLRISEKNQKLSR